MRRHRIVFSSAISIALASLGFSAHAAGSGHGHGDAHAVKALHGGIVGEARHLTFELVPQADKVTLHVRDHGKPVDAEGGSATLTVLAGTAKRSLELTPSGTGQLSAPLAQPIAAGSKIVTLVKLPGRHPAQVRFTIHP